MNDEPKVVHAEPMYEPETESFIERHGYGMKVVCYIILLSVTTTAVGFGIACLVERFFG